jgi:hypothetical protein
MEEKPAKEKEKVLRPTPSIFFNLKHTITHGTVYRVGKGKQIEKQKNSVKN